MRIDAYNQISQIYKSSSKVKTQKTNWQSTTDKVEISEFGKAYQTAKVAVSEAEDIRQDKVNDLKNRINNGTYQVTSEQFADKLLESYSRL